jgi:hypothetical protein
VGLSDFGAHLLCVVDASVLAATSILDTAATCAAICSSNPTSIRCGFGRAEQSREHQNYTRYLEEHVSSS